MINICTEVLFWLQFCQQFLISISQISSSFPLHMVWKKPKKKKNCNQLLKQLLILVISTCRDLSLASALAIDLFTVKSPYCFQPSFFIHCHCPINPQWVCSHDISARHFGPLPKYLQFMLYTLRFCVPWLYIPRKTQCTNLLCKLQPMSSWYLLVYWWIPLSTVSCR